MALNIFLSYGHDITEDATKIYEDLKNDGHTVWFDKIDINIGDDWLRRIEDGVKKTGFSQNSRFLLLMTPHIFREENGLYSVTRNEIQSAINFRIPIFPVMIKPIEEIPFNLNSYQYLDFTNCIPIANHQTEYKVKFKVLLDSLKNNKKDLFNYFLDKLIIDFCDKTTDEKLYKLLDKYTGRQWLVNLLNEWLEKDILHPVFCLQGVLGFGKSAFAAHIIKNHPDVLAYYFITFSNETRKSTLKTTLVKAFRHIIFQLTVKYPTYWDYLKKNELYYLNSIAANLDTSFNNDTLSLSDLLKELIINPIANIGLNDKKRVIIILDAVDELNDDEQESLLRLISDSYNAFPKHFRMVLTSRNNPAITRLNYCIKTVDITKDNSYIEENIRDIRSFISKEFKQFNSNVDLAPDIVEIIVRKSECLFLYLHYLILYLLEHSNSSTITTDMALQFPQGLEEIIRMFFDREYADMEYYHNHTSKILAVTFAAQNPLFLDEIVTLFNFSEQESIGCEKKLGTLFTCKNNLISCSHQFVYEWVTNKKKSADYFIDLKIGHTILAEKGEKALQKVKDKNISDASELTALERKLIYELPYHYMCFNELSKLSNILTEVGLCIHFFESDLTRLQLMTFFSALPAPEKMIPLYKENLKGFAKNNDNQVIARGYHVVGLIFFNLLLHIEAEYFYKRARHFYRKSRDVAKIAHIYNDLGEIYYNQGNRILEPLEDYIETLKKIKSRKTRVKNGMYYLRRARRAKLSVRKAIKCYEKAIDLRTKRFGIEHPETAESINNLGHAFVFFGQYDKSDAQYRMALAIREKVLLPYHKDIAEGYFNVGMNQNFSYGNNLEKIKEAIANIEKAIDICENGQRDYDQEFTDLPLFQYNLGLIYKKLQFYTKAIDHFENSLILYIRYNGANNKKSIAALKNYEETYLDMRRQGVFRNSVNFDPKSLNNSLERRLRMLPENSPEIILIHNIFAIVLINNGRPSEAEFYINESHKLIDRIIDDPILTEPYRNILIAHYQKYANLLINQEKYEDALHQIIKAFEICKTMELGMLSPQALEVYTYLVKVYLSVELSKRKDAANLIHYMIEKSHEFLKLYMSNNKLISKEAYHYLSIPFNEIAFHIFVPNKMWESARNNYKEAIGLVKLSGLDLEIANMELNLEVLNFRSGEPVNLEKVKQCTTILENQRDQRAQKGYYILQGPKKDFRKVLLRLFFAVAASDGKIETKELHYLYKYLQISVYDELFEEYERIAATWNKKRSGNVEFVNELIQEAVEITQKQPSVRNDINEIIRQLLFLSAMDMHVTQSEINTILKYIQPFGLGQQDVVKILHGLN